MSLTSGGFSPRDNRARDGSRLGEGVYLKHLPTVRSFKIADNQSPMPQDRAYFTFNYFDDLNAALNRHFRSPLEQMQALPWGTQLLARAILDGRRRALETYQRERDALSGPLFQITEAIASFRWRLDEVRALHERLSTSMRAEADHIAGLAAPSPLAA